MQEVILNVPRYRHQRDTLNLFEEACNDLGIGPLSWEGSSDDKKLAFIKVCYEKPESLFELALLYEDKISFCEREEAIERVKKMEGLANSNWARYLTSHKDRNNPPSEY